MNRGSDFTVDVLDVIPFGVVAIDHQAKVTRFNQFARSFMGVSHGDDIRHIVHKDSMSHFDSALEATGAEYLVQLVQNAACSFVQLSALAPDDDGARILLFRDVSEQIALSTQVRKSKEPERKFIHDVSNTMTTTIGYAELLTMMLEENEVIKGDRLQTIIRYHGEVYAGLLRTNNLITGQKQGRKADAHPGAPIPFKRKHVMVVDDEVSITDFLTELLRARHYKVSSFTNSVKALEFYKENMKTVDLVIMDQIMPEVSGTSLATKLLAFNINLPIVLCTGDQALISDQRSGRVHIKHFIRKPIDINELTQMVSAIFG